MTDHRNTPHDTQFLGLLLEELGEATDIAGKAVRFGIDTSLSPNERINCRAILSEEAAHVIAVIQLMAEYNMFNQSDLNTSTDIKKNKLRMGKDYLGRPYLPVKTK